ncbi:ATP-binding protein [Caenispirillum salinarum]|uniref:ATP-binding protein n=1 Tax=Caenispirillum salinarum TaxID=859058 RepID=UPI00384F0E14
MHLFDLMPEIRGRWQRVGLVMRRRLLAVLLLVGAASVVGCATFLIFVVERDQVGSLINTMGRQRMLAQRVALSVVELRDGMADAGAIAERIETDIAAMETGFARLKQARADGLTLDAPDTGAVLDEALRQEFTQFRAHALAAAALAGGPYTLDFARAADRIRTAVAGPLTRELEALVSDLEAASQRRYDRVRDYALAAVVAFLAFLALLGRRLLWPLSYDVERAVVRLAQLEGFQSGLLDHLPVGLLVLDADGQRVVRMNDEAEAIFGWVRDEMPRLDALFQGDWPLDRLRGCSRARLHGVDREGHDLHLEVSAGEADRHWLLIVTDITEEMEAKADIAALYKVLESIPVSIAITDTRGRIEFVNPRFGEMTGYAPSEAVGRTPSLLKSGRTAASTYETLWQTVLDGSQWRGELLNRRKDGDLFWEYEVITPLRDSRGRIVRFFVLGEDVTHIKENEERLRLALDAAEEANRVKSNFLASMSHELRTPLNAIIGYSELLTMGIDGPLPERYAGYANDIHYSGKHLLDLINNLLDLSKIEAGQMDLDESETRLQDIVDTAASLVQEPAERAHVPLNVALPDTLPLVRVDPLRVRQVLINLLSNAIKYSAPGSPVTVSARADAGGLALTVEDQGAGIPEEDMERVLQPFGQARSALVRKKEGTGLGLPICKQFIEMHGGTLVLDSRLGEGTRVTVRLPATRLVETGRVLPIAADR